MAKTTIGSIFELMNQGDLNTSAPITFILGGQPINPKEVTVTKEGWGQCATVQVEISSEWIDHLARVRMKEMYAAHVDAMFAKKEADAPA